MSELAEPIGLKGEEEGLLSRVVTVRLQVNWQVAAFAALVMIAAGMRFWDLGSRAFHHDESLHAWTAWKLFEGQGYGHEPWMHGPFQFFGMAFSFFLFGVGDYTTRIVPAVFGSALVAAPFFLRSRLGTVAALLAATAIAFSPTLLYFSRFARNDIFIAFFTLGLVVALWRYIDEQKPRYLYIAALLLGLSFATKESTFINATVLIAFLDIWLAVHFWRQLRAHNKLDATADFGALVLLLSSAWAIAALWPFSRRWRERAGLTSWHPAADLLIVLGTLTLPQFAATIQVPLNGLFGIDDASLARSAGGGHTRENVLGLATMLSLIGATAFIGLRWNTRVWALAAAAFYIPYALLYTTFFTNLDGFYSGQWGALNYWLEQQDVRRGDQPWFYYLMLLPAYDFLPLLFAAPALFYFAVRGDVFRRFLVFWTVTTMLGYSVAGEKMPWLSVNTALPVIILAACALGQLLTTFAPQKAARWAEPYAQPLAAAALGLGAVCFGVFGPADGGWVALRVLAVAAAAAGIGWLLLPAAREPAPAARGRRRQAQPKQALDARHAVLIVSSAVAGGLLAATLFVGVRATYQLGDVPRELLVYTQTSPFVPDLVDSIEDASRSSGAGKELPIVIDGGIEPWVWYLRDYPRLQYSSVGEGFKPPEGAIVVALAEHEASMQPYADQYQEPVRFPLRWWYPEFDTYKPMADVGMLTFAGDFLASLLRASTWETWWDYFRYRRPPGTTTSPEDRLGRLDMIAYFPKEYAIDLPDSVPAPVAPVPTASPPPLPALQELTAGLAIGAPGSGPGQLNQPGGLARDSDGNLYVADVMNHRIQKFDPEGNFLAQVGSHGDGEGQFNEPWDVTLDGEGNVYVADTFNHRIQKFDRDLKFMLAFGRPASSLEDPEPDAFWGPRGVAVGADGAIWIADGGTGRVLKYSAGGTLIEAFGDLGEGAGQFKEPTDIVIAPGGDILVADSGNRRIQRFDSNLNFVAEYGVPGWLYADSVAKPYIALLPDGGFIASDPTQNKLFRFDAAGKAVATLDAAGGALAIPRGLATDGAGSLYVAEAGSNQVRRLQLSVPTPP